MKFEVGDQVKVKRSFPFDYLRDVVGRVVVVSGIIVPIGVGFPTYYKGLHPLGGRVKLGHGWWFDEENLELTESKQRRTTMQRIESLGGHPVTIKSNYRFTIGSVQIWEAELQVILKDLADWRPGAPPAPELKVGDWVRLTEKYMDLEIGTVGKVREVNGRETLYVGFSGRNLYIWPSRVEKTDPPPAPKFARGTYVRLSRTMDSRGEYGKVTETRDIGHGPENQLAIHDGFYAMWYFTKNLDEVSEQEYRRNVTLKVGDTVRIINSDSWFVGHTATLRAISNYFNYELEFDKADLHREAYHIHQTGERHGHAWSVSRKNIELVG